MNKILSMMLFALPLLALTACHDEDDLPDVDFNFTIENATRADGYLYIVQGETMEITSIEVVNKDSGKPAIITAANFYWDYYYIGSAIEPRRRYSPGRPYSSGREPAICRRQDGGNFGRYLPRSCGG